MDQPSQTIWSGSMPEASLSRRTHLRRESEPTNFLRQLLDPLVRLDRLLCCYEFLNRDLGLCPLRKAIKGIDAPLTLAERQDRVVSGPRSEFQEIDFSPADDRGGWLRFTARGQRNAQVSKDLALRRRKKRAGNELQGIDVRDIGRVMANNQADSRDLSSSSVPASDNRAAKVPPLASADPTGA